MFDICCLQDKCTAHSFLSLCPSHSSSLSLSLSCRLLTALSCKSIANQSNKEPQQICLRRTRRRGRIDWWSWGGLGLGLGLAKWSTVDLTKLWLNCCNPNLSTEHSNSISLSLSPTHFAPLFPLLSLSSISFASPWWHFPLTEFYVDYRLRLQHFPQILTIMPLSIIYSAAALWPPIPTSTLSLPYLPLSLPLSQSVHLVHSLPKC